MNDVLERLEALLADRRGADPGTSYVAGLYAHGPERILKKVGEEAVETILAAGSGDRAALVHETADLWFHVMVMLADRGIPLADVLEELDRRFGRSGLEEKAARGEPGAP